MKLPKDAQKTTNASQWKDDTGLLRTANTAVKLTVDYSTVHFVTSWAIPKKTAHCVYYLGVGGGDLIEIQLHLSADLNTVIKD